ncbi:MAG: hypothetical protein Q9187_004458 [Circinaria calcarea]
MDTEPLNRIVNSREAGLAIPKKRDETGVNLEHSDSRQTDNAKSVGINAAAAKPPADTRLQRKPTNHGEEQAPSTSRGAPFEQKPPKRPAQNQSGLRSILGFGKTASSLNAVGADTHRKTARKEGYSDDSARAEMDVRTYQRERDAERQRHEQLRPEYCQDVEKLQTELQYERKELERVARSAHHLQTILDNKQFFLGPQAPDEDIRTRFSSIFTSIKTWSTYFMYGPVEDLDIGDNILDKYQRVLPLCTQISHVKTVIAAKKQRRLLVRGWAAFIAYKRILATNTSSKRNGTDLWLDKNSAQSFSLLEQKLSLRDQAQLPVRMLNDWRAWTAELLSKTIDDQMLRASSQTAIMDSVHEVMGFVGHLAQPSKAQELATGLCDIYVEAVRFAQLLRQQRAIWSVHFPKRPTTPINSELMFDPGRMRNELNGDDILDEETLKQQLVEITVTPALLKSGNADGEHYDKEFTAVPAGVAVYGRRDSNLDS